MSDDDKEYYKEKAKGSGVKVSRSGSKPSGLLTSQGVPCSVYEQEDKEKHMAIENMRRRVGEMVQKIPLMKGTFHFSQ